MKPQVNDQRIGILLSKSLGVIMPLFFVPNPRDINELRFSAVGIFEKETKLQRDLSAHLGKTLFRLDQAENCSVSGQPIMIQQHSAERELTGKFFKIETFREFTITVNVTVGNKQRVHNMKITDACGIMILDTVQLKLRGQAAVDVRVQHLENQQMTGLSNLDAAIGNYVADLERARQELAEKVKELDFSEPEKLDVRLRVDGDGLMLYAKGETNSSQTTELRRLIFSGLMKTIGNKARDQYYEAELRNLDTQRDLLIAQMKAGK